MLKLARRFWFYMTAKLTGTFNERADPKVQLEQAIIEAQDQHRRLREQAANVIASQKQTEMRLDRSLEELERVNANARQAVRMAEDATNAGDMTKANQYTSAAEAFATSDPYVTNGLVTSWRVRHWTTVVGPLAAQPIAPGVA